MPRNIAVNEANEKSVNVCMEKKIGKAQTG